MLIELIDIITNFLSSFTWLFNSLNDFYQIQVRNATISTGLLRPLANLLGVVLGFLG